MVIEVIKAHKQLCVDTARAIFEAAIDFTPVSSGNLRGSWTMTAETPIYLDAVGGTPGSPLARPWTPTIDAKTLQGLPTIFITNGKPYAGYVNDGSPTNRPELMIERALESVK